MLAARTMRNRLRFCPDLGTYMNTLSVFELTSSLIARDTFAARRLRGWGPADHDKRASKQLHRRQATQRPFGRGEATFRGAHAPISLKHDAVRNQRIFQRVGGIGWRELARDAEAGGRRRSVWAKSRQATNAGARATSVMLLSSATGVPRREPNQIGELARRTAAPRVQGDTRPCRSRACAGPPRSCATLRRRFSAAGTRPDCP
jgi:hypothetical protein